MSDTGVRRDARANRAKLVSAARQAYSSGAHEPSLDEIASKAGVGIATLHRHFPKRDDLVTAVFQHIVDDELAPLVHDEPSEASSLDVLAAVFDRILSIIAAERGLLTTAGVFETVTDTIIQSFRPRLGALLAQAQQDGLARVDLVEDDLVPLIVMLISTIVGTPAGSHGWRRYLTLTFDAIATPTPSPLPAVGASSRDLIRTSPLLGR
jgi:AcrR family transcriptional regulator